MKTRLVSFLIVALLLLCACAETIPTTELPTEPSAEGPSLSFVPRYGAFGSGSKLVALDDAQLELLTEAESVQSLADYPTFTDPYPTAQSGVLFETTSEMIDRQIAQGQEFLAHYYGGSPSDYIFTAQDGATEYFVNYKDDEMEVVVAPWRIHITLSTPYQGEFSAAALSENPIVTAALEWREIETYEVRENVEIGADGSEFCREISFAEHSEDPVEQLLNNTFRFVKVMKFYDNLFSVIIETEEPIEQTAETPAVSAEQLDAFLAEAFPNDPPVGYVTEVFYSRKVESGKYTPCYRVYLPETDYPTANGQSVFSVIEVTTAEIVAAADLPTDIVVTEAPMSLEQTEMRESIEEAEAAH